MRQVIDTGIKAVAIIVCVAIIFYWYPVSRNKSIANCNAINENRREGENRARVLKDLLRTAAQARSQSAAAEKKSNPEQYLIDTAAADHYRELITQIHSLPVREC